MNISRKLMALGTAFSVLGGTCAFARPALHSENVRLSHKANAVQNHVPTAQTPSAIGYAGSPPSTNAVKDDWPTSMHQE
jgi:hypothetical protein